MPTVTTTDALPREVTAWRVPLDADVDPAVAVLGLRTDARPFALIGEWLGGYAILGSEPLLVSGAGDDPFEILDRQPEVSGASGLAVGGGWVGWLGYQLGARVEELPPAPPAPVPRPAFSLAFYDHVIVHDGERWWFEALMSAAREPVLRERLARWRLLLRQPQTPQPAALSPFHLTSNGAAGHVHAVAQCRQRIAAGDLFQANLALRLEADLEGDLIDLFSQAVGVANPRFGALLDGTLSLSPERFLRRRGRLVSAEPIKGTRPRIQAADAADPALDELLNSDKDAAEHIMIVDLMRNDLGRVCRYGSIGTEPVRAEPHSGVWHLVSTVSGELRDEVTDTELLRATFPPGSVTGAPKVQAMKVINQLEGTRREAYTGAIGIASPVAGLDLSVAIRCFETGPTRPAEPTGESGEPTGESGEPSGIFKPIWYGAGGGIVADSDPQLELAEALSKAVGPIAALTAELAADDSPRTPTASHCVEDALDRGQRPDPAEGVFETLLVEAGTALLINQHLDRLSGSLRILYGAVLARDAAEAQIRGAAKATVGGRWRLRINASPAGQTSVTVAPADSTATGRIALVPFALPGGLGQHKWSDRRLLAALTVSASARSPDTGSAVPLIVDTDGSVLEAAHANVWIREGDRLLTPIADGRLLPGVTRAEQLQQPGCAETESITISRLRAADAVILSSSIAGLVTLADPVIAAP